MQTDLYIIAPAEMDAFELAGRLRPVFESRSASALLLPKGNRAEVAYGDLVRAIAPSAQAAGVAVLIEGDPGWVRSLGADGLHVTGDIRAVRDALAALKPDFIVGAGDIRSRHDAMQKGDSGVDYILFGPLSGRIDDVQRELALWWGETMVIPSVLSDPEAPSVDAGPCEFAGVGLSGLEHVA